MMTRVMVEIKIDDVDIDDDQDDYLLGGQKGKEEV